MAGTDTGQRAAGGVQSVGRAFHLLETLAAHGALNLSQISAASGLPLTTIHRLVGTLTGLGYLRQSSSSQYTLGPRLIHLGERASSLFPAWAQPHLARLVDELGETANLAMLDGDAVAYVAQAPSRHSMRMFTEVGGHVPAHCTAIGKALLAQLSTEEFVGIVHRTGLPAHTDNTITTPQRLEQELDLVRQVGFAVDNGERERGVRCVAVALPDVPHSLAISISGPAPRMSDDLVRRAVPVLTRTAHELAQELVGGPHPVSG